MKSDIQDARDERKNLSRAGNDVVCGQKFSNLTVLSIMPSRGHGKICYCSCDCGKTTEVTMRVLISGHTKSCGCRRTKHGFSHKERLYETWKNMRRRCNDPTNKRWKNYGGRGISICPEWENYSTFREWALSNGYSEDLTIDRIDNNADYSPENCRWTDCKTQANNTSRNRYFEYQGKRYTMSELAEKFGLTYSAFQHRVERGWSLDKIANTAQRGW